jgi:8-oxo-dGTP pyrophosphatase MutT (NUDIX family)
MQVQRPKSRQPLPEDAKKVFDGIVFDVYHWPVEHDDGTVKMFEKIKRRDTIVVIPVTESGKIIMAKEEQPHMEPYIACLGGRAEENEDPIQTAKRELLEEAGLVSDNWSLFSSTQPFAKIEWAYYVFIAKGCKKVSEPKLDGAEKIELMELSWEEFQNVILHKEFDDLELKIKFMQANLDNKLDELKHKILG